MSPGPDRDGSTAAPPAPPVPTAPAIPTRAADGVFLTPEGVPNALWWDPAAGATDQGALRLVDQSLLPAIYAVVTCDHADAVAAAIRTLQVRGAPAIGVAAAYGLALAAREATAGAGDPASALAALETSAASLRATRPTAVNLAWALDRLLRVARAHLAAGGPLATLPDRVLAAAHAIAAEDAAACRAMGAHGAALIAAGDTLLTHCNAGALATSGMGTALAPIFVAHAAGKRPHVYVDETRPVLQGARLTAWELARAGVALTLIADNMAAHVMRRAGVRAVFVGADRIAANGDVANKIGTYGLAILAREHGIPLYVVAPRSTVDRSLPDGDAIPIEERAPEEVTTIRGVRLAPADVPVFNPAFDITPARYVTAIVTEAGIARAPYDATLAALFAGVAGPP